MSDEIRTPPPSPETVPREAPSRSRPSGEDLLEPVRQQVAASTALMLQESGEQLRKLAQLSMDASQVALRMLRLGREPERASVALRQAREALDRATAHFQQLGQLSASLLDQLQPTASGPSALAGRSEVREPEPQQAVTELDPLAGVGVGEP